MNVLLILVVIYALVRMTAWFILRFILLYAEYNAKKANGIMRRYGSTVGALQEAGKEEKLDNLTEKGGRAYRWAVPLAAFLMYWPIGPWFYKQKMLRAYDTVGLFKGQMGSYRPWEDVRRGIAFNTDYYPAKHLMGYVEALRAAPVIF